MNDFLLNETESKELSDKLERKVIRNPIDLQRVKIEKLMKNPDKPVIIPETPKEKDFVYTVPTFVRNVMGSSAGAGSGEFHVYRNLRRKEYARQKVIEIKSYKDSLDQEYRNKIEKNRMEAEAKTAKRRAKRLKKKKSSKILKTITINNDNNLNSIENSNSSEESDKIVEEENEINK